MDSDDKYSSSDELSCDSCFSSQENSQYEAFKATKEVVNDKASQNSYCRKKTAEGSHYRYLHVHFYNIHSFLNITWQLP